MQSVLEVLNKCAAFFTEKGVPEPKLDAQILLAHALGCKRLELFLQFEKPMTEAELVVFRELAKRRSKREPLQHILGEVEFFGLKLKCDRRALIPRPETEELVDIITSKYFTDAVAELKILDLGTGSGAIALSLNKHFPNSEVCAIDASDDALSLASENATALGANRFSIAKSNWFENIKGKYNLIVSNPPYLTDAELESAQKEVKCFDPLEALTSPDMGLADLRIILKDAPQYLESNGLIACECGIGQPQKLAEEFKNFYVKIDTAPDLGRRTRYIFCRTR